MIEPRIEFGKWLRKRREENNWKQEQLAQQITFKTGAKISLQHISRLEKGQIELDRVEVEAIAFIFREDPFWLLSKAGILDPNLRQAILQEPGAIRRAAKLIDAIKISVPFSIASLPFAFLPKFSPELAFQVQIFPTSTEVLREVISHQADIALVTDNTLRKNDALFINNRDYFIFGEAANDKLLSIFKIFRKPLTQIEWLQKTRSIAYLNQSAGKDIAQNLRKTKSDTKFVHLKDNDNEDYHFEFGDYETIGFDTIEEIAEALMNPSNEDSLAAVVAWFPARIRLLQRIAENNSHHIPKTFRFEVANAEYFRFLRENYKPTENADVGNKDLPPKRNLLLIVSANAVERLPYAFITSFVQAFHDCRNNLKAWAKSDDDLLFDQFREVPGFEFCSMNWWEPDENDVAEQAYKEEIKRLFRQLIITYDFELLLKTSSIFKLGKSLW